MRVLVDADSMVYGCGFAVERTLYEYVMYEGDIPHDGGVAATKDELEQVRSLLPEGWTLEVAPFKEAEPLVHALALAKRQLVGLEEELDALNVEYERLELFLTGGRNFRDDIATLKVYKGNRIDIPKPVHYRGIRRYLRERWGALVIRGWEADDQVAMLAHQLGYDPERVCIVSQDKDLLTVPGRLYNYRKKEMRVITEQEARIYFWRQVLEGDPTDNVGGCYKIGKTKAAKLITENMTDQEAWGMILDCYEESQSKPGCPYADKDPIEVATENARLLHMLRWEGQVWTPPGGSVEYKAA